MPSIGIPILSATVALASYGTYGTSPLQGGAPVSTPQPMPAVVRMKITGPVTRKRTVVGATATLAELGIGTNSKPEAGRATGIETTGGVAVKAGRVIALSAGT